MNDLERWTIDKSGALYGINYWGREYFGINEQGNMTVSPDGSNGKKIDLYEMVNAVNERNIKLPVLFRFNGILRHRVRTLCKAFHSAIEEHHYTGKYFPAYPIKVNQQRHIVDEIRNAGNGTPIALEVGSKPELIAVLAIHSNPDALLICNGYKDAEYIEFALMSQKVGRNPIIVIEKMSELFIVFEIAEKLGVEPSIGVRLRLSEKGSGRWEKSGGDRAKFGLTIGEILYVVRELTKRNQLGILKLLHFHLGSQITSISSVNTALKEATQVYVNLKKHCPELRYLDVGGGLGVDYDGSKTNFVSSMNYTDEEYARDVVWVIGEICTASAVAHPDIVTESGRALVAHHAVLVFNVLGIANQFAKTCNPSEVIQQSKNRLVRSLAQGITDLTRKNAHETLHDAIALRNDMLQQFNMGLMSLEDRALGEDCYWSLLHAITQKSQEFDYVPEDLETLPGLLTTTYFCNFSVFQSLPDSWAIQQIFPIAPIHGLNARPHERIIFGDITCDSDGKLDRFPDLRDTKRYLPAHPLVPGKPYYFAAFLVGGYQEILGDMHNLFGDTNAVHVDFGEDGEVQFSNVVWGDSVEDVLRYVQYDKKELCEKWRRDLEQAVSTSKITVSESALLLKKYIDSFDSYTYLNSTDT
jgi:arginine decarboxylase